MCGIVGVVSPSVVPQHVVERMRDSLAHRGPDHAGLWRSGDGTVTLGHRRLSIIDLDPRSNQPMVSHDGRFVVTFNGEIYNFREIRTSLERGGVAFHTNSDTEVILEAFRRWGTGALDSLSGMFALAIWDERERRLLCARDRAGEKPLHYALVNGTFLCASEIKALTEWPGFERRVDYDAVIDFLAFGFVADPKSIWRDVRKVPPAHWMQIEVGADGRAVQRPAVRYWSLSFASHEAAPEPERIRETLRRAADEMAVADVPLGTFLSGGVDSSSVTAALSLSGHEVRSFTIGFTDEAYDERRWARQVAERYHTIHVERTVEPSDMVAVLDRLAWHYDEPFADYSSVPTYYLCREARGAITVALSGDGADEVFAGYRKYQRLAKRAQTRGVFPVPVARVVASIAQHALGEGNPWRRTLSQYGMGAREMLADMLCIGFPLRALRRVARGPLAEALRHYDPHRLVEHLLVEAPPEKVGLLNAMRHLDFTLTLPGDMLVKVDRASMAVALEVRPVFLHRRVMELAASLPDRQLASDRNAKIALKDAVRPWLPSALVDRRKQGFALPLPEWLTGDSVVARTLHSSNRSGALDELLDMTYVSTLSTSHAAGAGNFTGRLYAAFVLDRWFSKWMPA